MGVGMQSDELILLLREQWPCRESQLRQLSAILSPRLPSPSTVVLYGAPATGKSGLIRSYLKNSDLRHVVVNCEECVTGRHLLERTVAAVNGSVLNDEEEDRPIHSERCENLSALTAQLQRLLRGIDKYILVFDGIDRQREAPPTLLASLARLGEHVPNLITVLLVNHPNPRFLHSTGVPHIHFPTYTRNQTIHIISRTPLDIFTGAFPVDLDYADETHTEDKAWLWPRFCAAVFDSLGQSCARDIRSYGSVCHKIWPNFIAPVVKGDFGTRDFSRLLVAQRKLFQDENILLDSILATPPATLARKSQAYNLPYYAKYIVIAAYLCSSNPARLDQLYFSQTSERKRRKKGGGTARSGGGKPSQQRKLPRHLLPPSPFSLDRLLAVLHAILQHDVRSTIDIYAQIATLASLRLLIRAGGFGGGDPLEAGGKWKVGPAVSWDFVKGLAATVEFSLSDYVAD